jgi:3-isopropylmalate/(R)-2-methylmalate dehydratase small subunit
VERFCAISSPATPLRLRDVDTDVIIPMGRLVGGGGDLARYAFEALRYGPEGADGPENPDCALNRPEYAEAEILLAGANFGCGSSREPAVWVIKLLGYRCIVAPSFGDIFHNNCFQNGVLPITLPEETVEALALEAEGGGERRFEVDLESCTLTTPSGRVIRFEVNGFRREALLEGLDDIAMTRKRDAEIAAFQARDREHRPWIWVLETD